MSKEIKNTVGKDEEARREFLKKAGKVAVAVPAATLLVSATSKNAMATVVSGFEGNGLD